MTLHPDCRMMVCMCRPRSEGGRRCPAHQPATLGIKDYCGTTFGLSNSQLNHTFRTLRAQNPDAPTPTGAEYSALMQRFRGLVDNNVEVPVRARSMNRRFSHQLSDSELPDGATFYALKKMVARSRDQKREFVHAMQDYYRSHGVSRRGAYERFEALNDDSTFTGYSDSFAESLDGRTRAILDRLNSEEVNTRILSEEPRVTIDNESNGVRWGYDPDDGRTEISVEGNDYVYRNVPASMIAEIESGDGRAVLRRLEDNSYFHYSSTTEERRDSRGRWCRDCHKYRAATGHVCEPDETTESATPQPSEDAVVENAPETPEPIVTTGANGDEQVAAAEARLMDALAAQDAGNNAPARPTLRMTARRARWTAPMEDRETVTMSHENNDDRTRGAGNLYYNHPSVTSISEATDQGKIVMATLVREGNSNSYARDFNTSARVNMMWDVKFYRDDMTGDIKSERVGDPRCDCLEYQRNSSCRHVRSSAGNSWNGYLERDMRDFIRKVDPLSAARAQAAAGTYVAITPSQNNSRRQVLAFEGGSALYRTTTARISRAQQILKDGGQVTILDENTSGDLHFETSDYMSGRVSGNLSFVGNSSDLGYEVNQSLYCSLCHRNDCHHITGIVASFQNQFLPDNAVTNAGNSLQTLSRINESDWQQNLEDVDEMRSAFVQTPNRAYSQNIDAYLADYREARQRVLDGENPLPYSVDNPTNGICAPGKKAFGIEIEFDFPNGVTDQAANERIANELYQAGLADSPYMQRWHYNARTADPYTTWSLEYDATVAGEIVSPILHDTPETWENIRKICDIVKRNGGVASARCGQHIHMGTVDRQGPRRRESRASQGAKNARILQFYAANEDAIRRVQTDPARKKHRNTQYCSPLQENTIQRSLYHFNAGYERLDNDHASSVNFGYEGRIEFRGPDGSLDPGHIQAQVMMTAGIVSAAERGNLATETEYSTVKHQTVGTNARRLNAIRNGRNGELTDDEIIVSDYSYRNFVDQVFSTDHGRKMMVALAANTPWQ